jgi:hypothetical protein
MAAKITIMIPKWVDRICAWTILLHRRWKYGYTYRRIYLGEEKYAMVDPHLFYRLNEYHWTHNGKRERPYTVRYSYSQKNKIEMISMRREIMNFPAGRLVDHRNGNTLDNRMSNLRAATREENAYNKQKTKTKTSSKYIGVYFEKHKQRRIARIKYKERRIYFGCFKDEVAAAKARDAAARNYHGGIRTAELRPERQRSDISRGKL